MTNATQIYIYKYITTKQRSAVAYKVYMSVIFLVLFQFSACAQSDKSINKDGTTLQTRISPPDGFVRQDVANNSFTAYLRSLPMKPDGSEVLYYDGRSKGKKHVYAAVVDMEIGTRDLQQCADAVMRLRAEYLYKQKRFNDIAFNFTNGFRVAYSEWMKGKRISVKGNTTKWVQSAKVSNTYADFRKYMDIIFTYAGTLSLSKELIAKKVVDIKPGDVFIQGGSPGHAVIVVDVAVNADTKEKMFLLAQSYMPAQDIQILKNPKGQSAWYPVNFGGTLVTPEWTFNKTDLKEFKE